MQLPVGAERLDTYRGLMELRAAGKIRAIGETRSQLRWNMVGVRTGSREIYRASVEWCCDFDDFFGGTFARSSANIN